MDDAAPNKGPVDPGDALFEQRGLICGTIIFGVFVNLLVLTGPIFALQVYDRVLASRSLETLTALTLLMVFLFLVMGLLDHVRRRIVARIGERITSRLAGPVFRAMLGQVPPHNTGALDDLEILRQFFGSALFVALFDLMWLPVFLIAIAFIHPGFGWLSLFGATLIILIGLVNLLLGNRDSPPSRSARHWAELATSDPATTFGLNRQGMIFERWYTHYHSDRRTALIIQDKISATASITQTFRWFLQSAIIALGAYLVLQDQLTAGAIIATSVLLARVLAPIDLISSNSPSLRQLRAAWHRLNKLILRHRSTTTESAAICSDVDLIIDQLTVFPPGANRPALRQVNLAIKPEQSLGVCGASGAGKSAMIRAILGHWPLAGGSIRIGGIPVAQIATDDLHRHVGYLPQNMVFHDGTIGENISNFTKAPDFEALVQASTRAGAHDLIMAMAKTYDTPLFARTNQLPGGLLQQIALARALYGDPALLILDEPSNNLDAKGHQILNDVISSTCKSGSSALVFSQTRTSLNSCNKIIFLENGKQQSQNSQIGNLAPFQIATSR